MPLSVPSAATTRSASMVCRPSLTAGRSPGSTRTWRTVTPVRSSTRSPRPAISASCRSSRCTTTGIRSAGNGPGLHEPVPVRATDPTVGQRGGDGGQAGAEAEGLQRADAVGPEHHGGRLGADPFGAFQQGDLPAGAGQRAGHREATDPCADHHRASHRCRPRSAVPVGGPRASGVGPVGAGGRRVVRRVLVGRGRRRSPRRRALVAQRLGAIRPGRPRRRSARAARRRCPARRRTAPRSPPGSPPARRPARGSPARRGRPGTGRTWGAGSASPPRRSGSGTPGGRAPGRSRSTRRGRPARRSRR